MSGMMSPMGTFDFKLLIEINERHYKTLYTNIENNFLDQRNTNNNQVQKKERRKRNKDEENAHFGHLCTHR